MAQTASLILVGGSKGGVGKSLVSVALIDWLLCDKGANVVVVDSDDSNPDVHRVYEAASKGPDYPELRALNLDVEAGWIGLADCCEAHPDAHVVVNTGGRNITGLLAHAGLFLDAIATELPHRVVMLWVTNGQRDSVVLLARYLNGRGDDSPIMVHVVCNCAETPERDFSLYLNSQTAQRITRTGGRVMAVPTWPRPPPMRSTTPGEKSAPSFARTGTPPLAYESPWRAGAPGCGRSSTRSIRSRRDRRGAARPRYTLWMGPGAQTRR